MTGRNTVATRSFDVVRCRDPEPAHIRVSPPNSMNAPLGVWSLRAGRTDAAPRSGSKHRFGRCGRPEIDYERQHELRPSSMNLAA